MKIRHVGIISPGDMGQAVAVRLRESGFEIHTALAGRSARTRALAAQAGIDDCGDLDALVRHCDAILSILDPGAAPSAARAVADAVARTGNRLLFADCNAVAPTTKRTMDSTLRGAGAVFVDGAIIGPPPRGKGGIRLYVSGPQAEALLPLAHETISIRVVSDRVGDAAAVKMCYGAVTKGAIALLTEMLIVARRLGVADTLDAELAGSQAPIRDWILRNLTNMAPKAYRWVPETNEIAATFAAAGLTPRILQGAADMYEFIAATELGRESPEQARERARTGPEIIAALAAEKAADKTHKSQDRRDG
jgi:3-hydroxyisobutyrate dehydrogenase-like beta-hydroxyacid dehydrogenase